MNEGISRLIHIVLDVVVGYLAQAKKFSEVGQKVKVEVKKLEVSKHCACHSMKTPENAHSFLMKSHTTRFVEFMQRVIPCFRTRS